MAIALDNMVGYIRTRPKHGTKRVDAEGKPIVVMELWIDQDIIINHTPKGPVVGKPPDCAGILYGAGDGKLEVKYPEE